MKVNPFLSIITISYNADSVIEKTILSIINQSFNNYEYIIIDGGSKDKTVDIINKYSDKITYWISEPDNGIYDAMNKGINIAQGEWIHFQNCGDYFVNSNVLDDFFKTSVSDEISVIHGDCRMCYSTHYVDMQPPILKRSYLKGMPIFHPCSFIRTSVHKENKFSTKYRSSSDYKFFYDLIVEGHNFEYRPILVSTYNAVDGFSLNNWKIECYEIWDWKYPKFPCKSLIIKLNIFYISFKRYLLKIIRKFYENKKQ